MIIRNYMVGLFAVIACVGSIQAYAGSTVAATPIERGEGDMYGSVLLDTLDQATTDAAVERGTGDMYGSVLLDTPEQVPADAMIERGEVDFHPDTWPIYN